MGCTNAGLPGYCCRRARTRSRPCRRLDALYLEVPCPWDVKQLVGGETGAAHVASEKKGAMGAAACLGGALDARKGRLQSVDGAGRLKRPVKMKEGKHCKADKSRRTSPLLLTCSSAVAGQELAASIMRACLCLH